MIIRNHRFDSCLLKHYFGDPGGIRGVVLSPRKLLSVLFIPAYDQRNDLFHFSVPLYSSCFYLGFRFEKVLFIADQICNNAQGQSTDYVNNGVLLQEYGGNADQNRTNRKGDSPSPRTEERRVPCRNRYRNGADYMNGRTNIGVGVVCIEILHKTHKEVVSFKGCGAKKLTVGEDPVNHKGSGVCNHNKPHEPCESVNVVEKGIYMDDHKICEPEHIREYKYFRKGNQIVDGRIDRGITVGEKTSFRQRKENAVYGPPDQKKQMAKFVRNQIVGAQLSVIYNRGRDFQ